MASALLTQRRFGVKAFVWWERNETALHRDPLLQAFRSLGPRSRDTQKFL